MHFPFYFLFTGKVLSNHSNMTSQHMYTTYFIVTALISGLYERKTTIWEENDVKEHHCDSLGTQCKPSMAEHYLSSRRSILNDLELKE